MLRLADVLRRHGHHYMQRYGTAVLPSHVRAIRAVTHCRTPALGGHLARCTACGRDHLLYHSCMHRACPQCGHQATSRWIERQRQLLLPVPYFHVVFTLPAELRRLVRTHQRALLAVLFRAAFDSLAALCKDPRWAGGQIGALAVLHTWTRSLEWHPHIHMLVPAGALAADGRTWLPTPTRRKRFLVPVRALAKYFRGRFLHLARRALPSSDLPVVPWNKRWVVFAKPVVHGPHRVLEYLGRYVHRTAISDKAIVACDDHSVTFTYRDSRDHRRKPMRLTAHEFLRRFLQHVPIKGMHRVRAYGLLHPAQRTMLRQLQLLLVSSSEPEQPSDVDRRASPSARCPHCDQMTLARMHRLSPGECLTWLGALQDQPAPARAPPRSSRPQVEKLTS